MLIYGRAAVVMEFLSETDAGEYWARPTLAEDET